MAPASASENDEDDYLNMSFEEPATKRETLTERKKRLAREAEARANPKSKAELAALAARKREEGLRTSLLGGSGQSKGALMMAKLGYKPGETLGATNNNGSAGGGGGRGLLEPVGLEMKEGRGGIGADAERKRKFREEVEARADGEKRRKVDEGEYRERVAREREEKRVEGQVWGAMKVCERLDAEEEEDVGGEERKNNNKGETRLRLKDVNVLWRGLVKQREVAVRDKRMRYDLHQSLSRAATYDDPEEDREDRMAMGRKEEIREVQLDLDEDDEELDAFEALEAREKLDKLVAYLRGLWHYCFWCKFRYPDDSMEGCPGTTEEDHD